MCTTAIAVLALTLSACGRRQAKEPSCGVYGKECCEGSTCEGELVCETGQCLSVRTCPDVPPECAVDGTVVLATGQLSPHSIIVDCNHVYWTNSRGGPLGEEAPGSVVRMPLCGGTPETIAARQFGPLALAASTTALYWTTSAEYDGHLIKIIMKWPLGGGAPVTLQGPEFDGSQFHSPEQLALDEDALYWSSHWEPEGFSLYRLTLHAGSRQLVTRMTGGGSQPFFIREQRAYWLNHGLMSLPLAGGSITTLFAVDPMQSIWTAALDQNSAYIAYDGVQRIPLAGGPPVTLASSSRLRGGQMILAGDSLYWSDTYEGRVLSLPVSGGAISTVADGLSFPIGVTATASHLYWTDAVAGTISMAPLRKPAE